MLLAGDFGKIKISVLSRATSDDYWDGNWLYCNVLISIGFFTANYNCNLRTDEFSMFDEKLEGLLTGKNTESQFSSMEEGLQLNLRKDISGSFIIKGEAKSNENYKISLFFEVVVDYIQIEELRISVRNLLQRYPVVGSQ